MKKRHVYKNIGLWENSSENSFKLLNLIDNLLANYDEIANLNDGMYLPYDFLDSLTQDERKQLYLIGEQWLVTIHIVGYQKGIEGPDFAYTLNEEGNIDR